MVCQQQESQGRKEGDKRKSRERERTYKEREIKRPKDQLPLSVTNGTLARSLVPLRGR